MNNRQTQQQSFSPALRPVPSQPYHHYQQAAAMNHMPLQTKQPSMPLKHLSSPKPQLSSPKPQLSSPKTPLPSPMTQLSSPKPPSAMKLQSPPGMSSPHQSKGVQSAGSPDIPDISTFADYMVAPREFGKNDRLNIEAKRERLQVLNSPVPTLEELHEKLNDLQSSASKGLLVMATVLHNQLKELVAEEQEERVSKLRFNISGEEKDEDEIDQQHAHIDSGLLSTSPQFASGLGPKSTIGIIISDKPETFGFPGLCVVSACVPGSPAYFSDKIKPGDCIMQVNDVDVVPDNLLHTMRGNDVPGTQIKLLVDRKGRKRPRAFYLVCAPIESVAEKRVIFEKWAVIAQQVDTGAGVERRTNSCLQDKDFICGQDHDGVQPQEHDLKKYAEEMVAYMKKMEREYLQQEVIWQERIQRKDRALIRAQILIQEFLSNGTDLLMSEDKGASTIEADLSNANQKIQNLQEELDALKNKFAERKDAGIEVFCASPAAPPQSSKEKEPCATHAAPPQAPQPLPEDDIQNLKPSSLSAEDLQELREGLAKAKAAEQALEGMVAMQRAQIVEMQEALENKDRELEDMEKEHNFWKEEMNNWGAQVQMKEKDWEVLNQEKETQLLQFQQELMQTIEQLQVSHEEVRSQLRESADKMTTNSAEAAAALAHKDAELKATAELLAERTMQLAKKESAQQQMQQLHKQEVENLHQKLQQVTTEQAELSAEVESRQEVEERLRRDIQIQAASSKSLEAQVEVLEMELADMRGMFAKAEANVEALEKVAAVYKEQGKYEEALEFYQKAMATDSPLCIDLDKTKVQVQSQRINEMLKELSEMRLSGELNDDELLVIESKLTAASLLRSASKDAEVYALGRTQERMSETISAQAELMIAMQQALDAKSVCVEIACVANEQHGGDLHARADSSDLAADRSLMSKIECVQNLLAQQDKSPSE